MIGKVERRRLVLDGTAQDIRWAARTLRRQPMFTALALATLAIGIGTTTVAFSVLDTALLRSLPFADPDRLVMIRELNAQRNDLPPSYPNFVDWRDKARSFSAVVSELLPSSRTVFVGNEPALVEQMGVSRGFFEILGVRPVVGREFSREENSPGGPAVVMVSHRFWVERLGGRTDLGTLRRGDRSFQIIGVVPRDFRLIGDADIYVPHEQSPNNGRASNNYVVVGRLAPNATLESARAEMAALSRALLATYGNETKAVGVSMMSLHEWVVNDYRMALVIVFGAAALVLLIACTNLVSAQLARGLGRTREIGVRSALGASRARLVRQLLAESAVLAVSGALLGLGMTIALTRFVRVVGAPLLPRLQTLSVDGRSLAFAAGVTVFTMMIIGIYPALRLAANDPGDTIRGAPRNPQRRREISRVADVDRIRDRDRGDVGRRIHAARADDAKHHDVRQWDRRERTRHRRVEPERRPPASRGRAHRSRSRGNSRCFRRDVGDPIPARVVGSIRTSRAPKRPTELAAGDGGLSRCRARLLRCDAAADAPRASIHIGRRLGECARRNHHSRHRNGALARRESDRQNHPHELPQRPMVDRDRRRRRGIELGDDQRVAKRDFRSGRTTTAASAQPAHHRCAH
jgi:hypothetical protein